MSDIVLPGLTFWLYSLGLLMVGGTIVALCLAALQNSRCQECGQEHREDCRGYWRNGRLAGNYEAQKLAENKETWEADAG
jgi:hypothetical protein